jgi:hypothetical protein
MYYLQDLKFLLLLEDYKETIKINYQILKNNKNKIDVPAAPVVPIAPFSPAGPELPI